MQASQKKGLIFGGGGSVTSANLGSSGELPGKCGELLGNLQIALKIHTERSAGEVAGELLGVWGNSEKPREFAEGLGSLTPSQRHAKFASKLGSKQLPRVMQMSQLLQDRLPGSSKE